MAVPVVIQGIYQPHVRLRDLILFDGPDMETVVYSMATRLPDLDDSFPDLQLAQREGTCSVWSDTSGLRKKILTAENVIMNTIRNSHSIM